MEDKTNNSLTTIEQSELSRLESIIEKGLQTFVEVGSAFAEIKDSGLYKTYGTFEAYCKDKWGFTKTHVNRLINSAHVNENLAPMGVAPINERQSRPLSRLDPPQQKEAWKKAVETAPEGKVTANRWKGPFFKPVSSQVLPGQESRL